MLTEALPFAALKWLSISEKALKAPRPDYTNGKTFHKTFGPSDGAQRQTAGQERSDRFL